MQRQRKRRQDPDGDQIEMPEQVHRHVRRQSEDHGGENRRAPAHAVVRGREDRPRQRVHRGHVREQERQQQQVVGGDDRERLQERCRDERRQRAVWVVRDRRSERVEKMAGVKIRQSRSGQHVAHPPEVPEEAVVVARVARHRIAEVQDQRPRPGHREQREQRQRSGVRERGNGGAGSTRPVVPTVRGATGLVPYRGRGLTTSSPCICRQPSSIWRLQ